MAWAQICDHCGVMNYTGLRDRDMPERWVLTAAGQIFCDKDDCHKAGMAAFNERPVPAPTAGQE